MFKKILKIQHLFFILIIIIIFFLIQLFLISTKDMPSDYFPNTQMVKSFRGNLNNDEFTHIVDRLEDNKIQIKQINNFTKVAMVYDITNDMVRLVYTYEEDELKDDYITNLKANRDDIIIKSPLIEGTSWVDNIRGIYRIIELNSMVKTPAGKFETLVIDYENDEFNVREYYAKDIGLVKIVINNYLVNELVDLKIED